MYNLVNTGKDKQTGLEKPWLPLETVTTHLCIKASFGLTGRNQGKWRELQLQSLRSGVWVPFLLCDKSYQWLNSSSGWWQKTEWSTGRPCFCTCSQSFAICFLNLFVNHTSYLYYPIWEFQWICLIFQVFSIDRKEEDRLVIVGKI